MDRLREHFLATAAIPMDEDWHPGRCSSPAAKKHVPELIRECCQPTWAPRQVLPFQMSGAPNRQLAAKTEEGPSELEQRLIGQIGCLDAVAIEQRAVLGPKVTNRPAAVLAVELGVGLGYPAVRKQELEDSTALHARDSPRSPAQPHGFELGKQEASRPQ